MKKLLVLTVLFFTPHVYAEPVDLELPCAGGGTRTVTGDYDSATGEFDLTTVVTECTNNKGVTKNGEVTAAGSYVVTDQNTAELDVEVNSEMSRQRFDSKCTRQITGTHNIRRNSIEGSSVSNCEKTGFVHSAVLPLLTGGQDDEPSEEE